MTGATRYVGRLGGDGVDDSLSGPETVAATLVGEGTHIADPLSFPWHLTDDEHLRQPVIVDLRACGENDLVALAEVLPLLTPGDLVIAGEGMSSNLSEQLSLPPACFVRDEPADPAEVLSSLAGLKLRSALLREGLTPIVNAELAAAAGPEIRPLRVIDVGSPDGWLASMIPAPHRYVSRADLDDTHAESADLLLLAASAIDDELVGAALRALVPGGLIVIVLGYDEVRSSSGRTFADVSSSIQSTMGASHVVEAVWGLYERPGRPPLGGIVSIRPLAGGNLAGSP